MDKLDKRMNRYASELQKFLGESAPETVKDLDDRTALPEEIREEGES